MPEIYEKLVEKKKIRRYNAILVAEVKFRSVPDRTAQQGGYTFRGKLELTFTSYALNDEEIDLVRKELEKDDIGDLYEVIQGATDESLGKLQTDIDEILNDKTSEQAQEEKQM